MTAITEWVRNIIMVVLFASFLELLLPSSNMQRFIRVILGLTIMLAILDPALELIHGKLGPQAAAVMSQKTGGGGEAAIDGAQALAKERDRLTVELYKKDLARQVQAVVVAVDGVAEARVTVRLAPGDAGGRGAIGTVTVYVRPGMRAAEQKVPKVAIGSGPEAKRTELGPELKVKLRRVICELYQLRDNQVEITKWN